MNPDAKLYAALTAGSPTTITSYVGTRIYPTRIPVGVTIPAIAYQRTSTVYEFVIGPSLLPVTKQVTFDIFCIAKDYATAEAIGNEVEALSVDGIKVVDRSSTIAGDEEDASFASIITVTVDVQ